MRRPLALAALAALIHGLWALTVSTPVDWDPAYYGSVAAHIAAGEGAVSGSVLFLGALPLQLPWPADAHWMPLPSRVLVPFVRLWPAHGDQVITVVLGALWAPLAYLLVKDLEASDRAATWAGLLAAMAGGYSRFLSTPDSIALYGVMAGLTLLALLRERPGLLALTAALAALTRGDGLLLAPLLALPWLLRGRLFALASVTGPMAWAAWKARNAWLELPSPPLWSTLDYHRFVLGEAPPVSLGDRAAFLLQELPQAGLVALLMGGFLLPWPALLGAWTRRREPIVQGLLIYAVVMPLAALSLAPALGASGTVFRSGAAVFVPACALAALGLEQASSWAVRRRDYPPWLLPGLLIGGFALASVGLGLQSARLRPATAPDCTVLPPDQVVFSSDPPLLERVCGVRAVMLPAGLARERALDLAERYDIHLAWLPATSLGMPADEAAALLGWRRTGDLVSR